MTDRPRDSFNAARRQSLEQRKKRLTPEQQRALDELERRHREERDKLRTEQAQQRETAIRDAANRRMARRPGLDITPPGAPPKYRDMTDDARRQAERDVAGRYARDLTYLTRSQENEREQTFETFERENRRRADRTREQFRKASRETKRDHTPDRGRER